MNEDGTTHNIFDRDDMRKTAKVDLNPGCIIIAFFCYYQVSFFFRILTWVRGMQTFNYWVYITHNLPGYGIRRLSAYTHMPPNEGNFMGGLLSLMPGSETTKGVAEKRFLPNLGIEPGAHIPRPSTLSHCFALIKFKSHFLSQSTPHHMLYNV